MKLVDVNPTMFIDFNKESKKKRRNIKVVIVLEYQNKKNIFRKGLKQCLKQLKTLCRRDTLLGILTENKLLESFTKKNWRKKSKRI